MKATFSNITKEIHNNIVFEMMTEGLVARYRVSYLYKTRKNAIHKDLVATDIYMEQIISSSPRVSRITDAALFLERRPQWLLEELLREYDRQERATFVAAIQAK